MRDDDEECALFHALYPVTGGAVTDAPRVTLIAEPAVLGSHGAIGPMRSHCAMGSRPNGTKGPNGPYNAGARETRFGMFLFGHWIAHARVRGPYVDITFDPHSHEVAELLCTKLAPARLASLLALVLARCPDVARATRAREGILPREARKARKADRREGRKARAASEARKCLEARKNRNARDACEAREADRREEGESESEDTELVMLTDLAGPTDAPDLSGLAGLAGLPSVGLTDPSGLSDLARAQVVVFSSHGPRGAVCPNGPNGPHGLNGITGANGANGASAKWARVVSWDTESLARLAFHADVRK